MWLIYIARSSWDVTCTRDVNWHGNGKEKGEEDGWEISGLETEEKCLLWMSENASTEWGRAQSCCWGFLAVFFCPLLFLYLFLTVSIPFQQVFIFALSYIYLSNLTLMTFSLHLKEIILMR
jgi:hypothetical protein